MESIQPLIKHRFWILFGVAMILIPLGWWLGVGALQAKIQKEESEIKSAQDGIPKGDQHPNADWIAGAKKVNGKRVVYYDKHAEALYRKQRDLQTWPESIAPTFEKIPYLGTVPPKDCLVYKQTYFTESIPKLYKIVDPIRTDEKTGKIVGKVVFNFADLPMVPYSQWDRVPPESKELWEAQEDVWLLTALLKAIARVNEGDERIDTASIRRILHISLHGGTAEGAEPEAGGQESGPGGMAPSSASFGSGGGEGGGSAGPASGPNAGLGGADSGGMGGGAGGGTSAGVNVIMPEPEKVFGPLRPRKSEEGGDEPSESGGGMGDGIGMPGTQSFGGGAGGATNNQAKMSPYVDENPEEPFKTRGFVLVVLMKRREITRLQYELGRMSFPVEIKLLQHVDRDPDLRGISIFREIRGGGGGGVEGGAGGFQEGPMGNESGFGGGRIPGGAGAIPGGAGAVPGGPGSVSGGSGIGGGRPFGGGLGGGLGGSNRNEGLGQPSGGIGQPSGGIGGIGGMNGRGGAGEAGIGGNNQMPPIVQSALTDHGLCYVSIAGLMTIYQPPKPKSKEDAATNGAPGNPSPQAGQPAGEQPKTGGTGTTPGQKKSDQIDPKSKMKTDDTGEPGGKTAPGPDGMKPAKPAVPAKGKSPVAPGAKSNPASSSGPAKNAPGGADKKSGKPPAKTPAGKSGTVG